MLQCLLSTPTHTRPDATTCYLTCSSAISASALYGTIITRRNDHDTMLIRNFFKGAIRCSISQNISWRVGCEVILGRPILAQQFYISHSSQLLRRWTPEEDATLLKAFDEGNDYHAISCLFPSRSLHAIRARTHRLRGQEFVSQLGKGRAKIFTSAEDERLWSAKQAGISWSEIAVLFPDKDMPNLNQRYHSHLKRNGPKTNYHRARQKWSAEEDIQLRNLRDTLKLTWAQIAEHLSGRSAGACQCRYCYLVPRHSRSHVHDSRYWAESDTKQLCEMRSQGASSQQIAKALGRSVGAIREKIRPMQYETPKLGPSQYMQSRWSDEQLDQLRALRTAQLSIRQIAEHLGRSMKAVTWQLWRLRHCKIMKTTQDTAVESGRGGQQCGDPGEHLLSQSSRRSSVNLSRENDDLKHA